MNSVTVKVGIDEKITTSIISFDVDTESPLCVVFIHSPQGSTYLRFESHASSLHLLDELRGRLEQASRFLRGGTLC